MSGVFTAIVYGHIVPKNIYKSNIYTKEKTERLEKKDESNEILFAWSAAHKNNTITGCF